MVRFDADLTDPPALSSSSMGSTVRNWAGYIIVIGMAFTAITVAQNTVQPVLSGLLNNLPGVNAGGSGGGSSLVRFGNPEN